MVPMIRTILGGFLFSGDDVNKRVAVLSGGERAAQAADDHKKLMWEVGDLMNQWEALQTEVEARR